MWRMPFSMTNTYSHTFFVTQIAFIYYWILANHYIFLHQLSTKLNLIESDSIGFQSVYHVRFDDGKNACLINATFMILLILHCNRTIILLSNHGAYVCKAHRLFRKKTCNTRCLAKCLALWFMTNKTWIYFNSYFCFPLFLKMICG